MKLGWSAFDLCQMSLVLSTHVLHAEHLTHENSHDTAFVSLLSFGAYVFTKLTTTSKK